MTTPTSISQIDLAPKAGITYHNFEREWREEFIYFLMVDRFHDDTPRMPPAGSGRSLGISTPNDFYGGKIKGITRNLDYIAGLGCTAIWLSPVFENNAGAYHGYNTSNYLDIDPHFGTKQDLIDLVQAAHGRNPPMRIILMLDSPLESSARTAASRIGRPVRASSTRPDTTPPLERRISTPSAESPSATVTAEALPAW